MNNTAINKLLCAAMVSKNFCQALLDNPGSALESGYLGHDFMLTEEQGLFIKSIRAQSIEDFAEQVQAWISSNILPAKGNPAPQDKQINYTAGSIISHELQIIFEGTPYEQKQYEMVPVR